MKMLESKLPPEKFMRVHRSFIVNLDRIEIIVRFRIVFGRVYIPVSDQVCKKMQTEPLSITESKHVCLRKPAKLQYNYQNEKIVIIVIKSCFAVKMLITFVLEN